MRVLPTIVTPTILCATLCAAHIAGAQPEGEAMNSIRVSDFICEKAMTRAGRTLPVLGVIANGTEDAAIAEAELALPDGLRATALQQEGAFELEPMEERELRWEVTASAEIRADLRLLLRVDGAVVSEAILPVRFLPSMEPLDVATIPEPEPVESPLLVGAHHCPLWEADRPGMWSQIRKHLERVPALGFYAQENPEVADWETKWAVEHGIDFFIYCWYRVSQGGPIETRFSSALDDALFLSRFESSMRWTIMWENQARGSSGVADEADLFENLLPFWVENYFARASYLKVDNKPVLFVYRPEFLIDDLGSVEAVAAAFERMREVCREAGYDGLYILGEYRGLDENHLRLMRQLGLDYTFAYCWHVTDNPDPQRAIDTQMAYIERTQELGIIPQVVTVSQGWTGWRDEGSIWEIPPAEYHQLLRRGREFVEGLPQDQLSGRMLLLDNWNEWGEGHFLAPYTNHGFGYLDAMRAELTSAPAEHADLIPEDVGLGPYDGPYREFMRRERQERAQLIERAVKPVAEDLEGLVAWWAFDEEPDAPVALDWSGHRRGGRLRDAQRAQGLDGSALMCAGGAVTVDNHPSLFPTEAMTVECWVWTEEAGQSDRWIVNSIYNVGDTGFRLGLSEGRPSFAIPLTAWSHHVVAEAELPLGAWVHLAGTFDGMTMRLYMNGEMCAQLDRPGPLRPSDRYLTLGSYEVQHRAHFVGLLDEVRLYSRVLSPEEVASSARQGP